MIAAFSVDLECVCLTWHQKSTKKKKKTGSGGDQPKKLHLECYDDELWVYYLNYELSCIKATLASISSGPELNK